MAMAMAMKFEAVLKPLAARLACCNRPFMASTNGLDRLSVMPRTTASIRSVIVRANFLNGSSRLETAEGQALFFATATLVSKRQKARRDPSLASLALSAWPCRLQRAWYRPPDAPRSRGDVRRARRSHRDATEGPAAPGAPRRVAVRTARTVRQPSGGFADADAPPLTRPATTEYTQLSPIEFPIPRDLPTRSRITLAGTWSTAG